MKKDKMKYRHSLYMPDKVVCKEIDFAARLWGCFRALIAGALEELTPVLHDKVNLVVETIDLHVQRFFAQALQLDPLQLRLEAA